MYYGQHGNASLNSLFYGSSKNISVEEIYGVHYNSSIYQFTIQTGNPGEITMTIIEVTLISLTGLDYNLALYHCATLSYATRITKPLGVPRKRKSSTVTRNSSYIFTVEKVRQ